MELDYNKLIGANIRYERQIRNFTLEELADFLEIAPGFLGLIERGQRGTTVKNLCRISDFFSISLDELVKRNINTVDDPEKISSLERYGLTAESLIKNLNTQELKFIIEVIKNLRKFRTVESNADY